MNLSDYEAVWKRQEPPVETKADIANLRATFASKSRKLYATLLVRDLTEAVAGVIVAMAYSFFWWQFGKVGWPLSVAIVLILGVAGFFVRERFRARRNRVSPDAPLVVKVQADLAELCHQRRLVLKLWYWYFAPIAAAMAIQYTVLFQMAPPGSLIRDPIFILVFGVFPGLLIFWLVWILNRQALRKRIEPRLAELEKLHRELLSTS